MAKRLPNIGKTLKNELSKKMAIGEKKKPYLESTVAERAKIKKNLMDKGYSKENAFNEAMKVNTYRDKIFSYSCYEGYEKAVEAFERFCEETLGTKRVSAEEAKTLVQAFVDWGVEKGHSPHTIHIRLCGICKALGLCISDYEKPSRHYAAAKRSVLPAKNDEYNSYRAYKALLLNSIIGLRRRELERLKVSDIVFVSPSYAEVHSVGKGGKKNVNIVSTEESVSVLKRFVDMAKANGQEYVLTSEDMDNDADLHSERSYCARMAYNRVHNEIKDNDERRNYYKNEIRKIFEKNNKVLRENLDNPYKCRGYNKELLLKNGKEVVFDRVALMYVSCAILNHYRSDTTVQHYLAK
ncbi:MAG: hypothetical protein E7235_01035 [Lachnospiraceae bacterium]|nr:hypothetical protein [Lachnospiraceae bacterium]